jgi:hypothetical protein
MFIVTDPNRDRDGNLILVACAVHGRGVPYPRHLDLHHTIDCPTADHCAWCFHGTYAVASCDCPQNYLTPREQLALEFVVPAAAPTEAA